MRSTDPPHRFARHAFKPNGFTLIELLVVITIIVVLLSLLAPALDKAIHQAELMVCGTQQDAVITGLLQYALDHRRNYPPRGGVDGPGPNAQPNRIKYTEGPNATESYDDRQGFVGYIDINKMLNDPMVQPVDLEDDTATNSIIFSSVAVWAGFRYRENGVPRQGMKKMGDRLAWENQVYNLLVSDRDLTRLTDNLHQSSHPDRAGVLFNLVAENDPEPGRERSQQGSGALFITITSLWAAWGGGDPRGTVDDNFGYQDGSVRRVNQVIWNEPELDTGRTAWLPQWSGGNGWSNGTGSRIQVPRG